MFMAVTYSSRKVLRRRHRNAACGDLDPIETGWKHTGHFDRLDGIVGEWIRMESR
jgi:hypothetical protein